MCSWFLFWNTSARYFGLISVFNFLNVTYVCHRFVRHFLLLFSMHLTSISMFRFIASVFQTIDPSMTAGISSTLFAVMFGGFILPKCKIFISFCKGLQQQILAHWSCLIKSLSFSAYMPAWLKWGFWLSPLTYGEIGITVNEFLAPRWEKVTTILSLLQYNSTWSLFNMKVICVGPYNIMLLHILLNSIIGFWKYNSWEWSAGKPRIAFRWLFLLDISWCFNGIHSTIQYWFHLGSNFFKM